MEAAGRVVAAGDEASISAAESHHGLNAAKDITFGSVSVITS